MKSTSDFGTPVHVNLGRPIPIFWQRRNRYGVVTSQVEVALTTYTYYTTIAHIQVLLRNCWPQHTSFIRPSKHTHPFGNTMAWSCIFGVHLSRGTSISIVTLHNTPAYLTVIGVHDLHERYGRMHPNYCRKIIIVSWSLFVIGLLYDDLITSHSQQIALVARQLLTNVHACSITPVFQKLVSVRNARVGTLYYNDYKIWPLIRAIDGRVIIILYLRPH